MISKGVLSPAKIKDEKNKTKKNLGEVVHQNWRKRNKRGEKKRKEYHVWSVLHCWCRVPLFP